MWTRIEPEGITHPITNRVPRSTATLIDTNMAPVRQTAIQTRQVLWQTEENRTLLRCEHYVYSTVQRQAGPLYADNLAVNGQDKPPTASIAEVIRFAQRRYYIGLIWCSFLRRITRLAKSTVTDLTHGWLHVRRDIVFGTVCHLLWAAIKANLEHHPSPLCRFGDSAPSDLLTSLYLLFS